MRNKIEIDIYQRVLSQRAELRNKYCSEFNYPTKNKIKRIIVILGSSRSGSSLLYHLMSRHPEILSLQGEEVTFSKLFGLNRISGTNDSDEFINDESVDFNSLATEILSDSGYASDNIERLFLDRAQRILLQWPEIYFDLEYLIQASKKISWSETIDELKLKYPEMTTAYYDGSLGPIDLQRNFFIEEPPFIIPLSKTFGSECTNCTLILKSSINAFRASLLEKIFPEAAFEYIHLTRHPAAAINGLIDGWKSPAFHTHNLSHIVKLSIKGYDDAAWWKFDLPPDWINYISSPLEEVCAYQWTSSNKSILDFLKNKKHYRINYESLVEFQTMKDCLRKLLAHLSLDDGFVENLERPQSIMSVKTPQIDRWKNRANIIIPLIRDSKVATIAHNLGYEV